MVQTRRYSVEEFDQFVERPENADKLFEYIGGEIIEVPSNPYASAIASKISFFINLYLREGGADGYVTGADGGYVVSGERYVPDVAFISKQRQPKLAERGYNPNPPDLAVEVLSPSNAPDEMRVKVANYLIAGTTVWVVNPDKRLVEVYTPNQPVKKIDINGVLDGGHVLPGFQLAVKEIFFE